MTIAILLADDHRMMREGLRALVDRQADMEVVAEAADGRTAVELSGKLKPDVVVMDLTMPELNGIGATRQILAAAPRARVIILSVHADKRFITEAFRAGAAGYVLKDGAFTELANAIRVTVAGQTYVSPAISGTVIEGLVGRAPSPDASAFAALTEREREIVQLIAEGKSTKVVAQGLGLSVKTIETHRTNVMKKLGIRSIAELVKYAIREGLTPP